VGHAATGNAGAHKEKTMKGFSISTAKAAGGLGLILLIAGAIPSVIAQAPSGGAPQKKVADAKPGEIRVIASNGIREVLEAVKGQAEVAVGHPIVAEYGPSKDLKATIESGQAFEVVIVATEVLDEMIADGKVVAGSRIDVARAMIGIGQRGDAPKSDISTTAALRQTVLNAKSIRATATGSVFPLMMKMFESMGIAGAVKPKINIPGDVQLAHGEYELNVTLVSEILPQKNLVYLGEIPKELNVPVVMSAGIGSAGDEKAAKALIKFLQGPALNPVIKEKGMQR
jgi:molybdate transport system substrate-binding protein